MKTEKSVSFLFLLNLRTNTQLVVYERRDGHDGHDGLQKEIAIVAVDAARLQALGLICV